MAPMAHGTLQKLLGLVLDPLQGLGPVILPPGTLTPSPTPLVKGVSENS